MDRQELMRNLLKADRFVVQGENHVAARRRRLSVLERHGHPTDFARELLDIFEQTLAIRVADRDRLISELSSLKMHEIGTKSPREIAPRLETKSPPPSRTACELGSGSTAIYCQYIRIVTPITAQLSRVLAINKSQSMPKLVEIILSIVALYSISKRSFRLPS